MPSARNYSLTTYLTTNQVLDVLGAHKRSLKGYALIDHNQDAVVSHRHVLICLLSCWTEKAIRSWFAGFTDETGQEINTFSEACRDPPAMLRYFLHPDDDTKHSYAESEIIRWGSLPDPSQVSCDSSFDILTALIHGSSIYQLVRIYGRDFLYHLSCYERAYNLITGDTLDCIRPELLRSQINNKKE